MCTTPPAFKPSTLNQVVAVAAVVASVFCVWLRLDHSTELCCGTEAGSYLRPIDSCITQIKAQGPSRTCNEGKAEESEASTLNQVVAVAAVVASVFCVWLRLRALVFSTP